MAGTTAHDDGLSKPAIRLGQVALFWGTLQLGVTAIDAYTKWNILPALSDSFGPVFSVGVGLRAGLTLLALASVLIWAGMRPRKAPAPSLMERLKTHEEEQNEADGPPSLLHVAAVPLFLAIVCAGGFWGVERRYPHQNGARRQALEGSNRELQPLLDRHVLSTEESSAPTAPGERSTNRVNAFIGSLFAATKSESGAQTDGSARAGDSNARRDRSAAASSPKNQKGFFEKAYNAAREASTGSETPCAPAAGKAEAGGSSSHPCDTSQASGASNNVWQFDQTTASTK